MTPDLSRRTTLVLTRLEDRWNPATFVVDETLWDATQPGSLPWCIAQANATPGQDIITFDFSATGLNTNTPVFHSFGVTTVDVKEGVIINGGGGPQYVTITGETPFIFSHSSAGTDAQTRESEIHAVVFNDCRPAPADINTAKGGAIRVTGGQVTTVNARFTNNHANNGGAAYVGEDGTLVLDGDQSAPPDVTNYPEQWPNTPGGKWRTLFQDNDTVGGTDGGAIENDGAVILKRVNFFRNTAGNRGGAINNNDDNSTLYVPEAPLDSNGNPQPQSLFTDVTFKQNSAQQGGAVMFKGSNTSNLIGVNVFGNTAAADGGGFCVLDGTVNVKDSTMQGNTALRGAAVYILGAAGTAPTVDLKKVTFGGNTVAPGGTVDIDVSTGGLLTTHGCILGGDVIQATIAAGQAVAGTHTPDPNDPNTP